MQQLKCSFAADIALDGRKLSGVALPFNKVGHPSDGIPTIVRAGAFAPIGDVLLNVQHDAGRVIARTTGGTMQLSETDEAIRLEATLPETREADDTIALIKAGVLAGLSIEASALRAVTRKGVRTVERGTLTGIAVVARPGFQETSVKVAAQSGTGRAINPPWWLA